MNAYVVAMLCWFGVVGAAEASARLAKPATVGELLARHEQSYQVRTMSDFAQIDKFTARWNLEPFSALNLEPGDIEIRYWSLGFGIHGYVLRRSAGQWSALYFHPYSDAGYRVRPRCSEPEILRRLEGLGLWQLQTAPSPNKPSCPTNDIEECTSWVVMDGYSVVVETATATSSNRSYFQNPGSHYSDEADNDHRAVSVIGELLREQLGPQFRQSFKPHPTLLNLGNVALLKVGKYVYGYRVVEMVKPSSQEPGKIVYELGRVVPKPKPTDVPDVITGSWQHGPRFDDGSLIFALDGHRKLQVSLSPQSFDAIERPQLALSRFDSFQAVNLADRRIKFLAQRDALGSEPPCRRFEPLPAPALKQH